MPSAHSWVVAAALCAVLIAAPAAAQTAPKASPSPSPKPKAAAKTPAQIVDDANAPKVYCLISAGVNETAITYGFRLDYGFSECARYTIDCSKGNAACTADDVREKRQVVNYAPVAAGMCDELKRQGYKDVQCCKPSSEAEAQTCNKKDSTRIIPQAAPAAKPKGL